MADLLLELFSEEIPARMQADALEHLEKYIIDWIEFAKLSYEGINSYSTPRRITLIVKGLPQNSPDKILEVKGPKISAPQAAIDGFVKKYESDSTVLEKRIVGKDEVYFLTANLKGQPTNDLIEETILQCLNSFPWPKSMRWGSGETTWVRPLHSILCIFDGKVIPVKFAGVTANNITYGHRFLNPAAITLTNPADYESALEKAHVIADRNKRKATILAQAQAIATAEKLHLKNDEGLLEEVTGLVEYPVVLCGTIDAKYMDLPKEVLVSEMRAHQKYFALENADGSLSNRFLITANMKTTDDGKAIIAGNERVLRARLADGRFFWDQDRKKPLCAWAEGLKTVTYHAKLGTIADKVERIVSLADKLADIVKADKTSVQQAARLCKADLVTGMVGEFPELQGVMGRYYALAQGEKPEVADAIRDHYKPQGPTDSVPTQPVSICVALADKLDTLISMFAIGEKPTGSKDPFALRRAALGVIRIVLENNLRIPLTRLFFASSILALNMVEIAANEKTIEELIQKYKKDVVSGKLNLAEIIDELDRDEKVKKYFAVKTTSEALAFMIDRLKVQLKEQGIRHDVIDAVVSNGDDDLVRIKKRAEALQAFIGTDDGSNLLAAYKRAANILAIEEKKDNTSYNKRVCFEELKLKEEQELQQALSHTGMGVVSMLEQEKFAEVMSAFSKLRAPVDMFFEKVMVNDKDAKVRELRLNLLSQLKQTFDGIATFALIEGDAKEQKKAA